MWFPGRLGGPRSLISVSDRSQLLSDCVIFEGAGLTALVLLKRSDADQIADLGARDVDDLRILRACARQHVPLHRVRVERVRQVAMGSPPRHLSVRVRERCACVLIFAL